MSSTNRVLEDANENVTCADRGFILLDGTTLPLVVTEAMSEPDLREYLDDMTIFTLAALAARIAVLSSAVRASIECHAPTSRGEAAKS